MCERIIVMGGNSEACRRERGPMRRQLGVIFPRSEPWITFVTREMMICESPSTIRVCKLNIRATWRPFMMPQSLDVLFVSYPRKPSLRHLIFHVLSLMTSLNPASLGLPLDAPSKFNFQNLVGGHLQKVEHLVGVAGGLEI